MNFVIDNIDICQNVQNMTEENQNVDCLWVNANIVFNLVSGNNLIDSGCTQNVMDVDNSEVLPTIKEHLYGGRGLPLSFFVLFRLFIILYHLFIYFYQNKNGLK